MIKELTSRKYATIYANPPWAERGGGGKIKRAPIGITL